VLLSSPFSRFYYRPEKARFIRSALWRDLTPQEYFFIKFTQNTYFQPSSWLVSRKLTQLAGPWWELRSPDDDGDYFCRVVAASERIHFVEGPRCYWRVGNSGSFSQARSDAAVEAIFKSARRSIEHFRALEDSDRTRAACLQYLQDHMIYFYPEKPDLVEQMHALAAELGGTVHPPQLKWRYRLIQAVFGWQSAKQASTLFPKIRVYAASRWDQLMYRSFSKPASPGRS
jgi:hypothetical protein